MKEILDRLTTSDESALYIDGESIKAPAKEAYAALKRTERQTITAVDGGSAVLLETPSACIASCRIITLRMDGDMKKEIVRREGTLLAEVRQGPVILATFFPREGEAEEIFSAEPKELFSDPHDISLAAAVSEGRKILEWRAVNDAANGTKDGKASGLVVWDGIFTLKTRIDKEEFSKLSGDVVGLAKTTHMIGTGSFTQFFKEAPGGAWLVETEKNRFVKLHEKSQHIFRIEYLGEKEELNKLPAWAVDPIFLGYPYPLILVDQLARISKQECAAQKAQLMASAGEKWKDIAGDAAALDAHEILDGVQF